MENKVPVTKSEWSRVEWRRGEPYHVVEPQLTTFSGAGFSAPAVTQGWQAHAERLMAWAGQFNNRLFDVSSLRGADLLTH